MAYAVFETRAAADIAWMDGRQVYMRGADGRTYHAGQLLKNETVAVLRYTCGDALREFSNQKAEQLPGGFVTEVKTTSGQFPESSDCYASLQNGKDQ